MVRVTCRLSEKNRMERFGETTRSPQFSGRHKRGTGDYLNLKRRNFWRKKTKKKSWSWRSAKMQKPATGGGRELISWHMWSIDNDDGDTTILYKTFERGFILWHWEVMEDDGTMIEQNSLCLVTDWDILSFFYRTKVRSWSTHVSN